jgi:two-component sensor histidine kinase
LKPEGNNIIEIDFDEDENYNKNFVIKDNGKGFPENFDFDNVKTLGLDLVKLLVNQLEGTIKLDSSNGAKFSISF